MSDSKSSKSAGTTGTGKPLPMVRFGRPKVDHNVGPARLPRRALLKGSLAGVATSLALPTLDIMLNDSGTALAGQKNKLPTRFGVFYWGGGIVHPYWVPKTTGFNWDLPEILKPFASLRPYLTLLTGFNHKHAEPGHIPARGIALSSSHELEWMPIKAGPGYRGQEHPEPSVDSIVADHFKGQTLFDSINVGICRKGPYKSNTSWKAGGRVYSRHEPSPQRVFRRIFQTEADGTENDVLTLSTEMKVSLLDGLADEARRMNHRLGSRDKGRLDQHMDHLRDIEKRMQERERLKDSAVIAACTPPGVVTRRDYGDNTGHEEKEEKSKAMSEILATAIACDLTRVFSYEWSSNQSHAVYWETGARMEHHPMNHAKGQSFDYARTIQFIMKNFAYLAEQLRQLPEGDGNVLDNTLIMGTSEHASARKHDFNDHPFVFLGKASGNIQAGVHFRQNCESNFRAPRVLLGAVRAVGVPLAKLGQDEDGSPRSTSDGVSVFNS